MGSGLEPEYLTLEIRDGWDSADDGKPHMNQLLVWRKQKKKKGEDVSDEAYEE